MIPLVLASLLAMSVAIADHTGFDEKILTKIGLKYGGGTELRVRKWQRLIHNSNGLNDEQKLERVNDFFNGARFVNDITQWHQEDYWATPLEFLAEDAGDCEDFSIAKYFTLKEMGLDIGKLRITYVKAVTLNQAHMVLAYYPTPSAIPVILDNINKRIKSASERNDLLPVYSFNAEDLWLARSRNEQLKAGKSIQLGLWRELTERMERELL
ncbi:MAG: transglutaminase-like cysteine peptidase [Porticoccaceae bacterium]|nr:transglutaminase-like cysteine peptidase [Porticoccaceae bacterium]